MKAYLGLLFLWFLCIQGSTQHIGVKAAFEHIADNREYFSPYGHHQTILGARVNVTAGFRYDSIHAVHLGTNYLYEYGYRIDGYAPVLNLYYHYHKKPVDLYLGSFPRKHLLTYPLVLLTDTLNYYRPNLEGGFFRFGGEKGHQQVWIDWTSRQTDSLRESFMAGFSGSIRYEGVYLENYFYLYHLAGYKGNVSGDNIRDNGGGAVYLGYDFNRSLPFDVARLDVGYVLSYDRKRPEDFDRNGGLMARFETRIERLGMKGILYKGDPQHLVYGDPLYRSGDYIRLDPYVIPFENERIESRIELGFHIIEGELNLSQQVLFSIKFYNGRMN